MLNNMIRLIITSLFIMANVLIAQNQKPCSAPEAKQFDFWLGQWEATWDGGNGTNTISKILGGCVVHEEFKANGASPLIGNSNSVYVNRTKEWKQTWVDNQGGYLDFTGSWQEDRMILSRSVKRDTVTIIQRMVWYNITENAFDWNWESSTDNGQSWKINWKIHYNRKNN